MPRGGAREGAGRPAKAPEDKARMVSFKLPPAVIEAIEAKAGELGVSKTQLVVRAVRELVARESPPPP